MSKLEQQRVLVLNKNFQPINVINVEETMRLLYTGKAQVVHSDYSVYSFTDWLRVTAPTTNDAVATVTKEITIPEIIRLLVFDKHLQQPITYTRSNVLIRDCNICQYCGIKCTRADLTVDHVIPRSRQVEFGLTAQELDSWTNVVCCCHKCNTRKGNRTPSEANMKLRQQPIEPDWLRKVEGVVSHNIKEAWKPYLKEE